MKKLDQNNEYTEAIREEIDRALTLFDDCSNQITRHHGSEKEYYVKLASETLVLIGKLIEELPDKNNEIKIYTEKVQ